MQGHAYAKYNIRRVHSLDLPQSHGSAHYLLLISAKTADIIFSPCYPLKTQIWTNPMKLIGEDRAFLRENLTLNFWICFTRIGTGSFTQFSYSSAHLALSISRDWNDERLSAGTEQQEASGTRAFSSAQVAAAKSKISGLLTKFWTRCSSCTRSRCSTIWSHT